MKTTPLQLAVMIAISPLLVVGLVANLLYAGLAVGWRLGFDLGRFIFNQENPQ